MGWVSRASRRKREVSRKNPQCEAQVMNMSTLKLCVQTGDSIERNLLTDFQPWQWGVLESSTMHQLRMQAQELGRYSRKQRTMKT